MRDWLIITKRKSGKQNIWKNNNNENKKQNKTIINNVFPLYMVFFFNTDTLYVCIYIYICICISVSL